MARQTRSPGASFVRRWVDWEFAAGTPARARRVARFHRVVLRNSAAHADARAREGRVVAVDENTPVSVRAVALSARVARDGARSIASAVDAHAEELRVYSSANNVEALSAALSRGTGPRLWDYIAEHLDARSARVRRLVRRAGATLAGERKAILLQTYARAGLDRSLPNLLFREGASASVPRDETFLDYVRAETSGGARFLVFVRRASTVIAAADLGEASAVEVAARDLIERVARRRTYRRAARHLYRLIVAPIQRALRGGGRLTISPDGVLALVPFAALASRRGLLVDEVEAIRMIPSARFLSRGVFSSDIRRLPGRQTRRPPFLRVLAAPSMGATNRHLNDSHLVRAADFRELPWARHEAEAIRALDPHVRSEFFFDGDATEERLSLRGSDILHVAAHGILLPAGDGAHALDRAALLLTRRGTSSLSDGLFTAQEVIDRLDLLSTQLVVLSACETGRGEPSAAEGVIGFRQAFLQAGAESLVSTLWNIDDQASAVFMTEFYNEILAGTRRDVALQRAALRVRRRYPHPYYWSAFILSGSGSRLFLGATR